MNEIREACPVIAFMVQQATAEPGVESNFLRTVESGDIHACCDVDPVHAPAARVAERDLGAKLSIQAPFTDPGYREWEARNLR